MNTGIFATIPNWETPCFLSATSVTLIILPSWNGAQPTEITAQAYDCAVNARVRFDFWS